MSSRVHVDLEADTLALRHTPMLTAIIVSIITSLAYFVRSTIDFTTRTILTKMQNIPAVEMNVGIATVEINEKIENDAVTKASDPDKDITEIRNAEAFPAQPEAPADLNPRGFEYRRDSFPVQECPASMLNRDFPSNLCHPDDLRNSGYALLVLLLTGAFLAGILSIPRVFKVPDKVNSTSMPTNESSFM